jgi:hypothetical protein
MLTSTVFDQEEFDKMVFDQKSRNNLIESTVDSIKLFLIKWHGALRLCGQFFQWLYIHQIVLVFGGTF